jgi:AcrR family transcriptional regulator
VSQPEPGQVDPRALRKVPQQARSRAHVHAIYAAAERIVTAEGVDALAMTRLAAEAGVPVGTLYQFFEDRAAVLDAIAYRYMDTFGTDLNRAIEAAAGQDWRGLTNSLFDIFIERARANPAYVAIRAGHYLSAGLQRADDANIDTIATIVRGSMVAAENLVDGHELATVCRVAVQAADALLQLAFRLDRRGDADTLVHARRITLLYLEDIAARHPRRPRGTQPE